MKKTSLALTMTALMAAHGSAYASDYRSEASATFGQINYQNNDENTFGIDLKMNLERVRTKNRPLAEAAFLGHNSNINANYAQFNKAKVETRGFGGEFWVNDFFFAGNYQMTEENNDINARFGVALYHGLLVYAGLDTGDSYDTDAMTYGLKYVTSVGNDFINFEVSMTDNEEVSSYNLITDYYFTRDIAFGIRATDTGVEDADPIYGAGFRAFIVPPVSVSLEYTRDNGMDTYVFTGVTRF
ncbi:putative porin [Thalassolituus sp.]|uniref:Porin n=1 Tax=hydrothermal vent metagenome TaxID=652676 RepID=A0A160TA13_9ZZZZ|nr:hypothetical protein [Thalassolituus oleivorans]PCI46725.1 MAG: hypothetical protein COB43_13375 [Oceanospirillales bacterium]